MPGSNAPGTMPNTLSGGRSPVAGVTVAVVILAVILFLGPVAERIPFAALAAILIVVGWSIIDWRFIKRIHRVSRSFAVVMVLTFGLALFVDFATALVIGLVVAALTGSRQLESVEASAVISVPLLDTSVLDESEWGKVDDPFLARTGLVVFPDRVTVASSRELSRFSEDIGDNPVLHLSRCPARFMDDSARNDGRHCRVQWRDVPNHIDSGHGRSGVGHVRSVECDRFLLNSQPTRGASDYPPPASSKWRETSQ